MVSRKLVVTYPTEDPPTILVLSDYSSSPLSFGAESSNSPEFQTHLETFLSYLIFWQDVLEHCRSADVKQTLLDHFQVLFLQQLLCVEIFALILFGLLNFADIPLCLSPRT